MNDTHDDRLLDYVYGEMTDAEATAFERELQADAALRQAVDELRDLRSAYGAAPREVPPARAVHSALKAAGRGTSEDASTSEALQVDFTPPQRWRLFHPALGAAAALILVVAVLQVLPTSDEVGESAARSFGVTEEEAYSDGAAPTEVATRMSRAAPSGAVREGLEHDSVLKDRFEENADGGSAGITESFGEGGGLAPPTPEEAGLRLRPTLDAGNAEDLAVAPVPGPAPLPVVNDSIAEASTTEVAAPQEVPAARKAPPGAPGRAPGLPSPETTPTRADDTLEGGKRQDIVGEQVGFVQSEQKEGAAPGSELSKGGRDAGNATKGLTERSRRVADSRLGGNELRDEMEAEGVVVDSPVKPEGEPEGRPRSKSDVRQEELPGERSLAAVAGDAAPTRSQMRNAPVTDAMPVPPLLVEASRLQQDGEWAQALAKLDEFLKNAADAHPFLASARRQRVQVLTALGRQDDAREELAKLRGMVAEKAEANADADADAEGAPAAKPTQP